MEIAVKTGRIEDEASDAVLLSHWEGEKTLTGETAAFNTRLKGRLGELLKSGEFTGRLGQISVVHIAPGERVRAKRVVLVGLGRRKEGSLEKIRQAMGKAAKAIRDLGAKSVSTLVHGRTASTTPRSGNGGGSRGVTAREASRAMVEGALLGLYQFTPYRTEQADEVKTLKRMTVVVGDARAVGEIREGVRLGRIVGEASTFVRDLCNHPANVVTPTYIANEARKIAKDTRVRCKVLDRSQMQRLGMGAILGVARGSHEPPKFVILEYRGDSRAERPVALVGKTITFDSGGISIKPAENMEAMKGDMAGAAAVIAATSAIARLQLPIHVTAVVPATENLPSGTALKPGDILRAMSGKTIEVINTDAEGRLVLADALHYACRQKVSHLVDVATLTGACVVALGTLNSGAFASNQALLDKVVAAGRATGEKIWPMPMDVEYDELIKSDVAEIKNTGGRKGGAITAAKFLQRFVGETPWVHLDIAGTFETDKEKGYQVKGGTGVMVRTLVNLAVELLSE